MAEGTAGQLDAAHASTMRFSTLAAAMTEAATAVEAVLDDALPVAEDLHGRAAEAMRYAVFAGGKRLRPFLTIAGARLFHVPSARALRAAAAIEALHTYSLVHDDLPCMDDDDLRRGRPTTHKAFDEATAVLAGDGLLTIAFEILADPATHPSGEVRAELVGRLARAGGANGMIGGQMIDMLSAERAYDADQIILLQRMKTGALFEFSAEAGAILSEAGAEHQHRLRDYARDLGLAFQIADDLIDVVGATEQAGKAVGKDEAQGKATLVSIYGVAGARREAQRLAESAAERLSSYGAAADDLRALPFYLLDRAS
jgi:farnesyl diphosphate synthase